jgi:DNA-binding Lrp family transcriptional regulator
MNFMTEQERRIVKALDEPLPAVAEPYAEVARRAEVSHDELLAVLRAWKESGVLRRFGARVRHHELGYTANGMSVWRMPADKIKMAAEEAARMPEISHCYERQTCAAWDYNFYAMIHGKNEESVRAVADELSRRTGVNDYDILFSVKEFKKSAPNYGGITNEPE